MAKPYLFSLAFVWLSLLSTSVDWLEHHLLQCPFKKTFLIDCPGCGLQRSVIALLRGDMPLAWHYYPPIFPMLLLLLVAFLQIRFSFVYGPLIIKTLYIVCAAFIIVHYIFKLYNHQLM